MELQKKDVDDQEMERKYLKCVPDVYQPDIFMIDYDRLKDAGIKFISFDIDDTISGYEKTEPEKEARNLFERLRAQGFEIMLLSNNGDEDRVAKFAKKLGIEGQYIYHAHKPDPESFEKMRRDHNLEKEQMAHVGNIMMEDILGGKQFGLKATCLVRRNGVHGWYLDRINPKKRRKAEEHKCSEKLEECGLWRKHHKYEEYDQYYQFGEEPLYKKEMRRKEADRV